MKARQARRARICAEAGVSHQTEGMTRGEVLAFFNKDQDIAALGTIRRADEPALRSHESYVAHRSKHASRSPA